MSTVAEDPKGGTVITDELYEFSAPQFFDFTVGESKEEMRKAELWFHTALSYAPSPCMPKIKVGRNVMVAAMCDFGEADQQAVTSQHVECKEETLEIINPVLEVKPGELEETETMEKNCPVPVTNDSAEEQESELKTVGGAWKEASTTSIPAASPKDVQVSNAETSSLQACTPMSHVMSPQKNGKKTSCVKNFQSAKKIAGVIQNPSALRNKSHSRSTMLTKNKNATSSAKRGTEEKHVIAISNMAQENQAVKRQKLDEGRSRQILNVKPINLPHKSRPGIISDNCSLQSSKTTLRKEDRKIYVREPAAPFVSMAEMIQKFQSKTRELTFPHDAATAVARKNKLTLTRPQEPELETSQRARPSRIKSSAELEEEMMAKIPKFKARPVNKKILEAPTLPPLPRSTAHAPEFQEFHLQTMARASQHAETSSVASAESSHQHSQWKPHLTEPKSPQLQTSMRARPPKIKTSFELELEELQKIPKFKAKPLNKKIFESKGELGIFCTVKKQVTIPEEFHFATDERITQANVVADMFDKLSICSEKRHTQTPRITRPNPFHLHTEERGAEKEKKFITEVMHKQLEEERARVPKANPYPYTTDFPVVPPKPEPKQCTKPEPFQLESLVRHEDEMQREIEERQRLEKEETEMRIFKAQPILKDDPIPLPEKVRIPLTQVEEFNLQADHRAVDRAEFDKKVKDKESMYKRYREESEAAKMMEDEKALKQMRRTMVPHARPLPKFDNPFCPRRSLKDPTKPKSPKLRVVQRTRATRPNIGTGTALVSSAATNMR
uniref:Targeting protein for Xklp2 n=2 Tax=Kalanchoe fedtschenkoi TaxID=63787 RepID=A0A7N0UPA6_KALFE